MQNKRSLNKQATTRFIDDYLSYLLAMASYSVYRDFGREVKAAGLSSLEWRVLASLADSDGITIGGLAGEALAKQPTLTKLVNRMQAAGLVERAEDPDDARRTRVLATRAGRARVMHLLEAAKHHEARVLAPFATAEVTALKKILRALAHPAPAARRRPAGPRTRVAASS